MWQVHQLDVTGESTCYKTIINQYIGNQSAKINVLVHIDIFSVRTQNTEHGVIPSNTGWVCFIFNNSKL